MLSDRSIRGLLHQQAFIEPTPTDDRIQPASVDLLLGAVDLPDFDNQWRLYPGVFSLASTLETLRMPNNVVARVEGKSSWGRRGLLIHAAGFVDPGFHGQITLELKNLSHEVIILRKGQRICQIAFDWTDQEVERPYGSAELKSHYQGQRGPTRPADIP